MAGIAIAISAEEKKAILSLSVRSTMTPTKTSPKPVRSCPNLAMYPRSKRSRTVEAMNNTTGNPTTMGKLIPLGSQVDTADAVARLKMAKSAKRPLFADRAFAMSILPTRGLVPPRVARTSLFQQIVRNGMDRAPLPARHGLRRDHGVPDRFLGRLGGRLEQRRALIHAQHAHGGHGRLHRYGVAGREGKEDV